MVVGLLPVVNEVPGVNKLHCVSCKALFYGQYVLVYPDCSPDEPVWRGDGMEVGLLPVVHEGVRLPDLAQHLDGQGQRVLNRTK